MSDVLHHMTASCYRLSHQSRIAEKDEEGSKLLSDVKLVTAKTGTKIELSKYGTYSHNITMTCYVSCICIVHFPGNATAVLLASWLLVVVKLAVGHMHQH